MANPLSLLELDKEADNVGIIGRGFHVTRGELLCRGSAVAKRLAEIGADGGPVIVSLDSSPDFVAGLVGCWLADAVPVLLDPLVRKEILRALEISGARAVIRGTTALGHLPPGVSELTPGGRAPVPLSKRSRPDDAPVVYLFTSGSTGHPTMVPKTVGNLNVEIEFLSKLFECPKRVATLVPWCHIFGFIVSLLLPLRNRGLCDLSAGISPKTLLGRVAEGVVDLVVAVPAVYHAMIRYLEEARFGLLPAHCKFVSSGAPLSPELRERFTALTGRKITDLYGSTEAGGVAYRHDDGPWIVQPHVEARCRDDGFLEVRSQSVSFAGEDGFYRIGDLATFENGGFVLRGRADDVVKIGGRRTSLTEITEVLESRDEVAHAFVVSKKIRGVMRLVAFIELNPSAPASPESIKAHLRKQLADHKVPRIVRVIDSLPRTPAGKVDRQSLLQLRVPGE